MDHEESNAAYCLARKGTTLTLALANGISTEGIIQEVPGSSVALRVVVREIVPIGQKKSLPPAPKADPSLPDPGEGYRLLEPGELVEAGDEWLRLHDGKWRPTRWPGISAGGDGGEYRRKVPASKGIPEIPAASGKGLDARIPLRPFIPNKYTRYIPTLDGQCVPVDVYCVSEAFHLGTCLKSGGALDAVNHGRKKLLAPGQRGQKTALQDIKEAYASLGRAIEIEEAALGREEGTK